MRGREESQPAILIVDDEPDMVSGLRRLLSLDNYHVESAGTIAEMMDRPNWSNFVAILLDRKLPDGYAEDILSELKGLAPNAAVIIVTGHSDLQSTIASFRAGAEDYLLKPVDPDVLRTRLRRINELRLAREALQREEAERIQTQNMLRHERDRAQLYLDVAGVIMVALDAQGDVTLINRKGSEVLGYCDTEILGKNWFDLCLPDRVRSDVQRVFQQIMCGNVGAAEYFENPVLTKTGEERMVEWHNAELRDETGRVLGVLSSGTEITERKAAEQTLRDREEQLGAILNAAADAIITIDQRGMIKGINPATVQMFGYSPDELVGQNVRMLMPPPYCDEHDDYIARNLQTGEARIIGIGREVVGRRKDGSIFPVDLAVSEMEQLNLFTGVIRDISDRKELQKQVLEIAAEEDRRIGHELHEGVQQELTGMELFAGTLRDALDAAEHKEVDGKETRLLDEAGFLTIQKMTDKLCKGLTDAHAHVQQLSRGILPVQIDAEGLNSALAELAASTDALQGFTCRFEAPEWIELADNTTATHLYRIAQEAVNNSLRHGQADEIRVALAWRDGQLVLQVSDNGIGIDPAISSRAGVPNATKGVGLGAMHYRAGLIGATLHIGRREKGGTDVRCTVLRGG